MAAGREERLAAALPVDSAPAMFWVTEPDGTCSYLSDSWYAFTGQSRDEGLGFGWLKAVHPDDVAMAETTFVDSNARQAPFIVEYRLRRRDGAWRFAIDAASPRFADDGTYLGLVGAVLDITERHLAEERLRESEARLREVFTSIDEGYCLAEMIVDPEGRPVDYRFLETNPLFEEMTGLADAVGRTALELVPGLERSWIDTYADVALHERPLRFQSGSEAMGRFFDVFATPVAPRGRFALVFKDVTMAKQAEEALRRSEAAERRARRQSDLLGGITGELDAAEGFEQRLHRLVELLVPQVAAFASIEVPGHAEPVVAGAASGDAAVEVALDLGAAAPATLRLDGLEPELAPRGLEAQLARRIADRAGAVLVRSRAREEEHEVALRLQQALLPDRVLEHPRAQIAARYAAAGTILQVGGDWYDTFLLPDGSIGLAVGDVVGHGIEAAAAMGRLRTALAALAPHASGPGQLLAHLDAFAVGANRADFATACCAVLDPDTGRLRWASAGHPPMLVVAPDGSTRWLEEGRSAALFGRGVEGRPEAETTLGRGALLVAYSDGLVERRRESLDEGLARLARAAVAARAAPVDEVADQILAGLGVERAREDDVVVLCLRLV